VPILSSAHSTIRRMKVKAMAITIFLMLSFPHGFLQQKPIIDVIKIDGTINPAATDYIHDGIKEQMKKMPNVLSFN